MGEVSLCRVGKRMSSEVPSQETHLQCLNAETKNLNELRHLHCGQSKQWVVSVGRREGQMLAQRTATMAACTLLPHTQFSQPAGAAGYSGRSSWASGW